MFCSYDLTAPLSAAIALTLDRIFNQPPTRIHPVIAMGFFLKGWTGRPGIRPSADLMRGACGWAMGMCVCFAVGRGVESLVYEQNWLIRGVLTGVLLWPCFSIRMLFEEGKSVLDALENEGLGQAQNQLSRIVSRPVDQLDAQGICEATVESVAENLSDSVVAPFLWFAIFGLPGALAYRFANTADAMWGYRDHRQHLGRVAARADDVLNLVPARFTGLLILPDPRRWRSLAREAAKTPSPNGGWPMAATALRNGIRLRKAGVYDIHPQAPAPTPEQGRAAIANLVRVGWIGALLCMILSGLQW